MSPSSLFGRGSQETQLWFKERTHGYKVKRDQGVYKNTECSAVLALEIKLRGNLLIMTLDQQLSLTSVNTRDHLWGENEDFSIFNKKF